MSTETTSICWDFCDSKLEVYVSIVVYMVCLSLCLFLCVWGCLYIFIIISMDDMCIYVLLISTLLATAQQEKNMKKDIMAPNLSDNKENREARHQQWLPGRRAESFLCQVWGRETPARYPDSTWQHCETTHWCCARFDPRGMCWSSTHPTLSEVCIDHLCAQ